MSWLGAGHSTSVLLSALPLHWPTTSQHAAEVLPVALVASATRRSGTSQTTSVLLSVFPVQRPTTGEASGEDCVQQAVLSSATDMSHVTPAHWAVAPGIAANPAPQSWSDTAATPAVVAPFASSQVPKTHVTAPLSVLGVVPSASAVVPAHAAQASVGAAENCPETHAVQVVAAAVTAPVPAPTSATFPAAQALQAEASVSSLYSPAPHAVQAPSSEVVLPAQPWPTPQAAVLWAAHASPAPAHSFVSPHAVQQAALSVGKTHPPASAQVLVAPDVASKPSPQSVLDTTTLPPPPFLSAQVAAWPAQIEYVKGARVQRAHGHR